MARTPTFGPPRAGPSFSRQLLLATHNIVERANLHNRRLAYAIAFRFEQNLKTLGPRRTGLMASGWRVTIRTRRNQYRVPGSVRGLDGYQVRIRNTEAPYWLIVNFWNKSPHKDFVFTIWHKTRLEGARPSTSVQLGLGS